ncbi:MAG TPA: MBL fold metallo-hydrolase [Bryobacteraceae bacterium]|nr:MBL fold metallo-hydrolase [Bryobacteraceae bacterium]
MKKEPVRLTSIDGPTLLIEFGGLRILTDPTFDEPQQYRLGAKTFTKRNSPAVRRDLLLPIDVILLSHDQHFDNLDKAGRDFLPYARMVLSTSAAEQRLGGNTRGLAPWSEIALPLPDGRTLKVTATPARHGPAGFEGTSGQVIGFVLSIGDSPSIYVSGDTVWYEGVAEVARRFQIGVAILFAGSAQPLGPFNVTMSTNDVIEAAAAFSGAQVVTVHDSGWSHYTQTQADIAEAFEAVGIRDRLQLLRPGRPVELDGVGEFGTLENLHSTRRGR